MRSAVEALLTGDTRSAIAVTDPVEGAALHDYGPLIEQRTHYGAANVTLDNIQFADSLVSGGTRVSLKSVRVTDSSGETVAISVTGSCFDISSDGDNRHFCLDDKNIVDGFVEGLTSGRRSGEDLNSAQRTAVRDLLTGSGSLGVVTVQRDGKWYVSPLRSSLELSATLLSGLKGDDGKTLVGLIGGK